MSAIGAMLERLTMGSAIPDCERCGGPLVVVSEERVAMVPPVFDVTCRCSACGVIVRVRQILPHFE
jgi:uncharacterized protein with PIN domain